MARFIAIPVAQGDVGLPAGMAARRIVEGNVVGAGVQIPPTLPQLWQPLLEELELKMNQ